MAAPRGRTFAASAEEMQELKAMEAEMNRFEQEIQKGQDDEDEGGGYAQNTPIVPPGIPQALSVLGTPDPNLMNLRFPAPPPVIPPPSSAGVEPTQASSMPTGTHLRAQSHPSSESAGFSRLPRAPSTLPPSTRLEGPHSYPRPGEPRHSQPFPSGIPGNASNMASRPAFVPHQVRSRAPPVAPHRPPMYPQQHGPQMRQDPRPQGYMHPMGGGPMNYPRPPHPMARPGYPPVARGPVGVQHHNQAVIQAKPTTYSAKPVKFSQPKLAEKIQEMVKPDIGTIPKPDYSGHASMQMPAFTPAAVPQSQGAGQMYAVPDYSNMQQQQQPQQQQQQQQQAEAAAGSSGAEQKKKDKKKKFIRTAANTVWEDESLTDWDSNDFRIFCGDLGNEVTDDLLTKVFGRYNSFVRAKVVRDKRSSKTKGYGFVSFRDPNDFVQAMREWNGKYVGNRPIKLRKSTWKDRNIDTYKKKQKEKQKLGLR